MYTRWLELAKPGLPRALTYVLMWVLFPFLFVYFGVKIAMEFGFSRMFRAAPRTFAYAASWLWLQRKTLNSDLWKDGSVDV